MIQELKEGYIWTDFEKPRGKQKLRTWRTSKTQMNGWETFGGCWSLIQSSDRCLLCSVCLNSPKIHSDYQRAIITHSSCLPLSVHPPSSTSTISSSLTLSSCHIIYADYSVPLYFPHFKLVKHSRPYVELEFYLSCLLQRCVHIFLNLYGWSFLLFFFFPYKSLILFFIIFYLFFFRRRSNNLVIDTDTENSLSQLLLEEH